MAKFALAPDDVVRMAHDRYRRRSVTTIGTVTEVEVAKLFDIQLVYLQTYLPNLNLIERVWKFVKKKALANRHFADFRSFQNAIDSVLDGLDTTFQAQTATLPTHNFETLNRPPVCTV